MTEFNLQILSPEKIIYQGSVVSLVAPGVEGYLGVMANHAPMLAALTVGEVKVTEPDGKELFFSVAGGVLEVSRESVTILADSAEKANSIDTQRAEQAKGRASERISHPGSDIDVERARAALMRAINRLRVASRPGGL